MQLRRQTDSNHATKTSPQADDHKPSESPEEDQITANNNEDESLKTANRSRLPSRERSSSSEDQACAASIILEPTAAEQVGQIELTITEKPGAVSKEKKPEKRPSATRRSLSRRVKRQCPPRDIPPFLKSPLSQEEPAVSLESDSQDSQKGKPISKSIEAVEDELPLKRSRIAKHDNVECNDKREDNVLPEGKIGDEKLAIVPIPEVLNFKEADDEAPGEMVKPEVGVGWSDMEMGLYEKGLQMFGKNRYGTHSYVLFSLLCY